MVPVGWIGRLNVYKLLAILFLVYLTEGKPKESKKILPIELVLSHPTDRRSSSSVHKVLKGQNKAFKLKIHSDDDDDEEGGKLDLIIAATKQVQATEQNLDRYSPAFNAEDLNNKSPKIRRTWDNSFQDSSMFYPSTQSGDMFPYLGFRQVLRSPQPLLLGRNQFSPLQGMGHFDSGLQTQLFPFMNPSLRSYEEMGLVMPQTIFSNGIATNQENLLNSAQILALQQGLLRQLQQQNQPYGVQQQLGPVQNRYVLLNTTPSAKKQDEQNDGARQNTSPQPPPKTFPPYEPGQNLALQRAPDILGHNKQLLPLQNRPEYILPRNLPIINVPAQRILYQQQQSALPQQNQQYGNQLHVNNGNQGYHPTQNSLSSQQPPLNQHVRPPGQNLPQNPQQLGALQQRPLPGYNPNDPQVLYRHHHPDHNRLSSIHERHPPLRDINGRPLFLNNQPQQGLSQQQLSNNLQALRNGQIPNQSRDDRRYPIYHNVGERARHLPSRNIQQTLTSAHPQGLIQQQSNLAPLQEDYSSLPANLQDSSFGGSHSAPEMKDPDSSTEGNYLSKQTDKSEDSSAGRPKRRRKNKKRIHHKEKDDDLEGHSSHQYIIKIG